MHRTWITLGCIALVTHATVASEEEELSLSDLMNISVTTVSKKAEPMTQAPASIVVITQDDIRKQGYTDLGEVLSDLPGFDVMVTNGVTYLTAFQRGYRSSFTQRTLFMIDGKVENALWTQTADITRQYPLSNVERIEVLYGPASAVYGPNAFMGVINIITTKGNQLEADGTRSRVQLLGGSWNTQGFDASLHGKQGAFDYSLTARVFNSDEADLSGKWGFLSDSLYGSQAMWGPLLNIENSGRKLGSYYDPTNDYSIFANVGIGGARFGAEYWKRSEGYGPYYTADHAQNNVFWNQTTARLFAEHDKALSDKLRTYTLLDYRSEFIGGNWAEATPDWAPGAEDSSYVSFSSYATWCRSWLGKQEFSWDVFENLQLQTGAKYEVKELSKNYNIPGYWGAYSTGGVDSTSFGEAIVHSREKNYQMPAAPVEYMPYDNLTYTRDYGAFLQAIYTVGMFRFNSGLRYDENSLYGYSVNPRLSAIANLSDKTAFKLIYGEAFQEPSPILLWGGWNGRNGNMDYKPEKARNLELVGMQSGSFYSAEVSLFASHYDNVIESDTVGSRSLYGSEVRTKFRVPNPIPASKDIALYANYSYVYTQSNLTWDIENSKWVERMSNYGDIAPHKVNFGVNIPVGPVSLNVRNNFVSARELYAKNALAASDYTIDPYLLTNLNVAWNAPVFTAGVKVNNLFDTQYFLPGGEDATSGNDFSKRSNGFNNSLLPTAGRNFLAYVTLNI